MHPTIGMLGYGQMAQPIADVLRKAGYQVVVFARREEVRRRAQASGCRVVDAPRKLQGADVMLDLLTDTTATWDVLGEVGGLAEGLRPGQTIVDMTTSDPDESRRLAEYLASREVRYLDAPITGGVAGAKVGQLVFMVGGDPAAYADIQPLLGHLSKACFYLGPTGSGHAMKLVHNQLSHSTFLATCEAVLLGRRLGLEAHTMIDVFNAGNARSYATEVRFPKFILSGSYDAGATFDTVYKDISIVARKGRELELELPITAATLHHWEAGIARGLGHEDYSTVLNAMEEAQGRP
ncbi:MAG: NAD(P)-dependent oxidoreductase [Thermoleophilia bacterium]|nr:NAD(P)-dependent oxidoreductase [Thermoleophilia bacterium]